MLDQESAKGSVGRSAYTPDGDKIGTIGQVFLDDQTGEPEFITVVTGFFGNNESFVPIAEASPHEDGLTVPFTKDQVKDAPNVSAEEGHVSQSEERRIYDYYGMSYSEEASDSGLPSGHGAPDLDAGTTGHDVSGPTTDQAMTRSEERLDVGTRSEEAGRVRLRKYVVTEEQQVTVPVVKERAVLEREPVTDANIDQATDGPAISEEEHEVVLHEERPVVSKTAEPVERVRLGKEQETHQEQVTEQVRKEQVEVDGIDETPRGH